MCRELLRSAEGVRVVDDVSSNLYPMPLTATSSFDVEVGRIRTSLVYAPFGLDLFVSGDQLLRGAALNAVLIALKILELKSGGGKVKPVTGTKRPLEEQEKEEA